MLVEGTLDCKEVVVGREEIVEVGGARVEVGDTGADSNYEGLVRGLLIEIRERVGLIKELAQRPVERG